MAYTTINKSSDHFNTKLYTGNGGTQTISGVGFQPDFTWVKSRNYAYYHYLQDAVRGSSNVLYTNNNNAEATGVTAGISAWNSDGYVTGSQGALNYNGRTFVAWNWLGANGTVTNTEGTVNSTVSANTTAGFSIVKYDGASGALAHVGHGLGAVPKMIIVKRLEAGGDNWFVYHSSLGATKYLSLNTTDAQGDNDNRWYDTEPLANKFTVGDNNGVNGAGKSYIAYCFAEKQGYSKFGSYIGNGNVDGTFTYTGFKPAWILIKRTDNAANWELYDSKRLGYNASNPTLYPDTTSVEGGNGRIDILANGFKIVTQSGNLGAAGGNYIYMAFAEAPLVGSNNVPCTAR